MTAAPLTHMGLSHPCETCMALPGQRCQSGSGRILDVTHDARMRAALYAPGTARKYVLDAIAGRWGA